MNTIYVKPKVGMGATIQLGSDCYPATIIEVRTNKMVMIQQDDAVRTDNNGISEDQRHDFTRNLNAHKETFTLRNTGYWVPKGLAKNCGVIMSIGSRRKYYNYSR